MTDYFLKYNHFGILKNYILKDPLCDWFEIQTNNPLYQKDNNSRLSFKKPLLYQSISFLEHAHILYVLKYFSSI